MIAGQPENVSNNIYFHKSQIQQPLPSLPGQGAVAGSGSELLGLENSAGTEFGPCLMMGIIFFRRCFLAWDKHFIKQAEPPLGFQHVFPLLSPPQFSWKLIFMENRRWQSVFFLPSALI